MTFDARTFGLIVGIGFGAALSIPLYAEPHTIAEVPALAYCATLESVPVVRGTAAYVFDIEKGVALFEKNPEAQLPLASVSKVMTVYAALETLEKDEDVLIQKDALTPDGEWGLAVGDRWDASELAAFTLIESSNDGARALMLAAAEKLGMSEADFIDAMNRRARGLDLVQTYFINETGLDQSSVTAGAYGSARDIAALFAHVALTAPERLERSALREAVFTSASGKSYRAENTALLASLYGSAIGSKTGFTDLAGGNLAFIYEPLPGRPVSIAVLGSTREDRERDVAALAEYAARVIKKQSLCLL